MKINITTKRLSIYNITESELDYLLNMYNDFDTYFYATGINSRIKKGELIQKLAFDTDLDNSFVIVAKDLNNEFIGCMKGSINLKKQNVFWLSMLMIDKPYINMGYGSEFYTAVEEILKQKYSINEIYISVSSLNNVAIYFWRKLGFKKDKSFLLNNINIYSSHLIYIYLKYM